MIQHTFKLSTAQAGLLTTLPLLAFAAVSPFAALLAQEYGIERAIFGALIAMTSGIALRSSGPEWGLYLGTWVIGSGIAVANVLLPSLIKRDFPRLVGVMTAVYALTMTISAGACSALAIPIADFLHRGWPIALATVAILPLVGTLVWVPQLGNHTKTAKGTPKPPHGGTVWHSPLAWQVAVYLGLTCFIYFAAIAWLPSALEDYGYSAERAGSLHGWMQLAGALPGLILLPLLRRLKDQRALAFISPIISAIGLIWLVLVPSMAAFSIFLFGLGMGSALILSLAFLSLRADSLRQAASLSGMAQSVGYLVAAAGPPLAGGLHDVLHRWDVVFLTCAVFCGVMSFIGLLAGRAIHVDAARR